MKKWIAAFFALPWTCLQAQTLVDSFDNIQYWIGTGQNRAALVLQWNDGLDPVSVAWGYRWDGTATGIDMLRAIAGSTVVTEPVTEEVLGTGTGTETRLSLRLESYSFGLSVLALEYEPGDGPPRTRNDWSGGYWQYFIRGGRFEYTNYGDPDPSLYDVPGSGQYEPTEWFSAPIGAGDRELIDGAWDAYSFAPGFVAQPVQQPVAADLPVPVASCAMSDGTPSVSALGQTGLLYQLEYSENPAGPWNSMGDSELGTGGEIIFRDESSALPPRRFYRIAVRQAP